MVHIRDLIDDAKCFETVRALRWPEGVTCPHCASEVVRKDGKGETQPHRQRYRCRQCHKRFDDLTGTIFAGHHQPLRIWIICLYFMGLNLSSLQIAQELDLNRGEAQRMIEQLRQGVVTRRPDVVLSGEVECDEVYVVAGHKGNPDAVKKRTTRPLPPVESGAGLRHAGEREAADLRHAPADRRGRDPHAGQRPTGDHRPLDSRDDRFRQCG